ncbi:MAG TPA: hypothetical protein VFA26_03445 [Gemmataceae bacterium]|nr:hypothetical protein [Gemmataceae bacterium]
MRRLLTFCSAVGLLCGALGCHTCCGTGLGDGSHKVHGRCDCEEPSYGCHWESYCGHGDGHAVAPAVAPAMAPVPQAEPLKALPKEVTPPNKEDGAKE